MIEPVVVENRTKKSPEDAFRFFVEEIHSFWPMGHSIGEEPRTDLIIELKKGGRFYEVCGSTECDWGRVLEFETGESLLLAWHLDAKWEFDPENYTEVLVTFEPEGAGTLVRLEHSKLERYGDAANDVRASLAAATGWPDIMGTFEKRAA